MRKPLPGGKLLWVAAVAVLVGLVMLTEATGWIVEWLWMGKLGYSGVYWGLISTKLGLFIAAFAVVFGYLWLNLRVLARRILQRQEETGVWQLFEKETGVKTTVRIPAPVLKAFPPLASAAVALAFGSIFYTAWDVYLRFRFGEDLGKTDPIFGADIGFYLFRLPFYEFLQNNLVAVSLIALAMALVAYAYAGAFRLGQKRLEVEGSALRHISVLALAVVLVWAWGYYLDRFNLMFSTEGVTYGAGYTDYHVVRIGLWVMLFASLALAAVVLVHAFVRRTWLLYAGVGLYAALLAVLLVFLPSIVQKFKVQPNELGLEEPYIKHNIDFTREAYLLDRIEERKYPALGELTPADIAENRDTLSNIRLWDWRPILQTYRQTQEIRAYYKFYEVDVDRYRLEDGYRQVMLSARELEESLPQEARTWVNQHLQFTHGYGMAMSLVSGTVEEGLPEYLIKDLPPKTGGGLEISQPEVYYGEGTPGYRVVSTDIKEFNYPLGDENVYTSYQGRGGIAIDSVFKRLLFAWHFSDVNILLSGYITPESRVQMWRRVRERVSKVAPFLRVDRDPYLVLSQGRLYWIQDAYTVSSHYPYAEPYRERLNYIRNSVKAVVDAYHGTVDFYTADPEDPVLSLYKRAFPGVFKPLSEMPGDLRAHIRYPEDLFSIQVDKYKAYHMTIPQVFYNREDLWTLPREKYAGSPIVMEPYSILIRLPDEERLQYLIMTPVTPDNRDNMIAWIAGKSDLPDYGKVIVYKLPKERVIYGPIQIEAMIDQDDVISQQLSLWDQRGSRVIRGNLLVIPLGRSFLYVEPVYLIAEETNIPQLKRIIAVHGKRVAMEPTLEEAIRAALGRRPEGRVEAAAPPAEVPPPRPFEPPPGLSKAREEFKKAEEALRKGQWERFGEAMESLRRVLEESE